MNLRVLPDAEAEIDGMSDIETTIRRLRIVRRAMAVLAGAVCVSLVAIVIYGYRTLNANPAWHKLWNGSEHSEVLTDDPRENEAAP